VRRVAVTGIGVVTPIGTGRRELWESLLAGRSGFAPVASFDTGRHPVHVGAEVKGFRAEDHLRRLDPARLGRASQMAAAAALLALADAGLEADLEAGEIDPETAGVSMGTTSGEPLEIERLDDRILAAETERVGAEFIERYPCHTIAASVASELGFEGGITMIPAACAAGNYAVAHAFDLLRTGRAEVMVAGGRTPSRASPTRASRAWGRSRRRYASRSTATARV